jgi:hypothetical protein
MSANKFTERLTRENAAVVFIDHQVGLCSGVRDIALAELKHNARFDRICNASWPSA